MLSWPAPPLEWIGHSGTVHCTSYSPNGCYIVTGSKDKTIRIWDAETGEAVGKPLEGHTRGVTSVTYSPDGRHIASGSYDKTIRIWNAETGDAVGKPFEGHTHLGVTSVAYSPDGRHIVSGSYDKTIRIWNAETGDAAGKPLEGHTHLVLPVAYSPDGQHIVTASSDGAIQLWDSSSHNLIQSTSASIQAKRPDAEGWVRDSVGGLLYWVPQDCRVGLHSPALFTIPLTSPVRSVSLQFEEFTFGTSWTQIFNTAHL